jgi:hypothetical protein
MRVVNSAVDVRWLDELSDYFGRWKPRCLYLDNQMAARCPAKFPADTYSFAERAGLFVAPKAAKYAVIQV